MSSYKIEYSRLNDSQRDAVDTIEGPLVVVAGPGTGKTQLLSMRAANIMQRPDVVPSNILCLTFTDNAARNMRERLESIVGQAAAHVGIYTFHSFGADIINRYPEYFTKRPLMQQIDELGSYEIIKDIFDQLPHSNQLSTKIGDEYIFVYEVLNIISWLKQQALAPNEFVEIINDNQVFFENTHKHIAAVFEQTPSQKLLPEYNKLLSELTKFSSAPKYGFASYANSIASELNDAIDEIDPSSRFTPSITAWRNRWLKKNETGEFIIKDSRNALNKIISVADVYDEYQKVLARRGLFDYSDMIVEAVHALEENRELRLNIQERYQYIMVDEFQDTNKAQLRILQALANNPVYEQRPNIMVVGDDDQAIYAFQGAESSNILQFMSVYADVKIVTLIQNYRSTQSILDASRSVVLQARNRFEQNIDFINKELKAKATHKHGRIEHKVLPTELQQYQWIAQNISEQIDKGRPPHTIAILAPKHKYLERIVPFLGRKNIPIAYERKEDILNAPIVRQLTGISKLTHALANNDQRHADALFGEVLSYDFWQLPLSITAMISINAYNSRKHWLEIILSHQDKKVREIGEWFLENARQSRMLPLEYMFDRFIGNDKQSQTQADNANDTSYISPFKNYYFSNNKLDNDTQDYLALLGHLSTLRHRIQNWKPDETLYLEDYIDFVELHIQAHIKIIDSNPHTQSTNAVQIMTAYKAKGLEFDSVFLINAQDSVWGVGARSKTDSIRLPLNLPIKPTGDQEDDRIRLLYVALTRARHSLCITSYTNDLDNKLSAGLSFIGGHKPENSVHSAFVPNHDKLADTEEAIEILASDWEYRYKDIVANKPTLFEPILQNYKLSATHLNNFLDIVNGGPSHFLRHNLLRFPEAISPNAAYGDAIHVTLQWVYTQMRKNAVFPPIQQTCSYFEDVLNRKHLPTIELKRFTDRGEKTLRQYLADRVDSITPTAVIEKGFHNEGANVSNARLSGKIDKISIEGDRIYVTDFKTGKPAKSWKGKFDFEKIKLHKYRQQLLFYKLLIEHSATYKTFTVKEGALEFVEPDDSGELVNPLSLTYDKNELQRFQVLIGSVWKHIQSLNFPDISNYNENYSGLLQFEDDLIAGAI